MASLARSKPVDYRSHHQCHASQISRILAGQFSLLSNGIRQFCVEAYVEIESVVGTDRRDVLRIRIVGKRDRS